MQNNPHYSPEIKLLGRSRSAAFKQCDLHLENLVLLSESYLFRPQHVEYTRLQGWIFLKMSQGI